MSANVEVGDVHRREYLRLGTTVATALFAGCTGTGGPSAVDGGSGAAGVSGVGHVPRARLEMEAVTDADIARRSTPPLPPLGTPERRAVRQAAENGTATLDDDQANVPENQPPSVPTETDVVVSGSVCRFSSSVIDSRPATVYHYTMNPPDGPVSEDETVRYEDLPSVDRRKLSMSDPPFIGFSTKFYYTPAEKAKSALVPTADRSVIAWGPKTRGRITIDDSFDTELRTYRYASHLVDSSAVAYGRRIRERYGFVLSGLPADQRSVLRRAIHSNDPYVVPRSSTLPAAFAHLVDRFRPNERVLPGGDDVSGQYVVRYRGSEYWADLVLHEKTDAGAPTNRSTGGTNRSTDRTNLTGGPSH